jgi:aspartate aminotransferase
MPRLSARSATIPASPIRKLVPLANAAKARGIHIHHLNIGQPDLTPPPEVVQVLQAGGNEVLAYSESPGDPAAREAFRREYAQRYGVQLAPDQLVVTTGGSEALVFAFASVADPGDEILTFDPTYANYLGFSRQLGIDLRTVPLTVDDGWALPNDLDAHVSPRTRAIVLCNPGNPTGAVYPPEEVARVLETCKRHDLFLICDEVYRDLVFDGTPTPNAMALPDPDARVIVVDSLSKRYSLCGIRIGALVTRNGMVMDAVLRMGQARLSPPLLGQRIAAQVDRVPQAWLDASREEYRARVQAAHHALAKIPGVSAPMAQGAFYQMATLPVDDAEAFTRFLLSEFDDCGETTMVAPANGFYLGAGLGRNQVRLACVLQVPVLVRAIEILGKGLAAYSAK